MRLEPSRARLLRGESPRPLTAVAPGSTRRWEVVAGRRLHVALVAAASAVALTSSGDSFFLAGLLGLVAADVAVGGVAALACAAVTIRFGASSLAAIAGAQGVLGPAVATGDFLSASSVLAAALALALVGPRGLPVIAFGLAAGAVAAGPDVSGLSSLAVRIAGAVVGVAVAWVAARYLPRRTARWSGAGLAVVAVGLAAAGRLVG